MEQFHWLNLNIVSDHCNMIANGMQGFILKLMIYCCGGSAKTRTILYKKYKSFSHIDEKNCKDSLVYIVKQCNYNALQTSVNGVNWGCLVFDESFNAV